MELEVLGADVPVGAVGVVTEEDVGLEPSEDRLAPIGIESGPKIPALEPGGGVGGEAGGAEFVPAGGGLAGTVGVVSCVSGTGDAVAGAEVGGAELVAVGGGGFEVDVESADALLDVTAAGAGGGGVASARSGSVKKISHPTARGFSGAKRMRKSP